MTLKEEIAEILENLFDYAYEHGADSRRIPSNAIDQTEAEEAILKAVRDRLPEKQTPKWNNNKLIEPEYANERRWGFNQAIDLIEKELE